MIISLSCTSDGQDNIVRKPELQIETPNSDSDSNSTEETSGNTSDNSNSGNDSSTENSSSENNSSTESNSTNDGYQTTADLNKIHFIDEEIGFMAGDGLVLKTNNGGQTWTSIKEDKNIKFTAIHFENESIGLVGGNDGFYSYVYLTNNGGLTWELIASLWYSNESSEVINIFGDSNSKNIILFINQYPNMTQTYGHIYVSTNTGQEWNRIGLQGTSGIGSVYNLNKNIYFVTKPYWSGSDYRTSFYHSFFISQQSERLDIFNMGNLKLNDIYINSEISFGCSDKGSFAISSDLGKNWTLKSIYGYGESDFILTDFVDNLKGLIVTDKGEILTTYDGGANWNLKYSLGQTKINDIKFLDQSMFLLIGDNGFIDILDFE